MSRVGSNPVTVPSGVDVKIDGRQVTVKGAKGTLEQTFAEGISFDIDGDVITVQRANDEPDSRALHGLSRALLNNMVVGVSEGYRKELEAVGVGYRASLQGKRLELQVGFSHPVHIEAPDGITFEVHKGETLGLVGESGCGKSTTGRCILRLDPPSSGEILFDGQDMASLSRADLNKMRERIQVIFQDPYSSLNARMRVRDIVAEPIRFYKTAENETQVRRIVDDLLDHVGLGAAAARRYPHEFSGGQRQRIGIARALALNPGFIVADEPVSALDVSVQSQVLNLIAELKREMGIAFLFISHDLAVIQHVSDEIGVMYLGKIVETASAEDLYRDPKHPYTKALMSAIPIPDVKRRAKRIVLEGDIPSPMNPPSGCPFHTRCAEAMPKCSQVVPKRVNAGTAAKPHYVSCHLFDDSPGSPA